MRRRLISVTELRTRMRCRREHQYAYVMRRRPAEKAEPLELGTLVHRGLEEWWTTRGNFDAAITAIRSVESDPWLAVQAEGMLVGYHARWHETARRYEPLEVEDFFRVPRNGYDLGGAMDAVVRERDTGRVLLVEHKTTGADISPDSSYWAKLAIDPQISLYVEAAGRPVDAVLYDVIQKPRRISPLKATPEDRRKYRQSDGALYAGQRETDETLDEFRARYASALGPDSFARLELARTERELDQARWEVTTLADEILEVGDLVP